MFSAKTGSELTGVQGVHFRLAFSVLVAACAGVLVSGPTHYLWLSSAGVALLAVGAGITTLWSP